MEYRHSSQPLAPRRKPVRSKTVKSILNHSFLILVSLVMMLPFFWMVLASFKTLPDIESGSPWPKVFHPENYKLIFEMNRTSGREIAGSSQTISFAKYYFNSLLVALWVTFLQTLTSAMAAYAFARLRWPGRDTVFKLYLATLMIPGIVTMIPNYALMVRLHLLDSYSGLIVPVAFSAFGTFLLRQFMLTIPTSLDEAAEIDGASKWRTFWEIILPLARPGLIALGIFTFLGNYGSFYWPFILIKSEYLRTLPIGLLQFDTIYGRQTNLLMAASTLAIIPPIILFLAGQKFLVKGIQLGAVKG